MEKSKGSAKGLKGLNTTDIKVLQSGAEVKHVTGSSCDKRSWIGYWKKKTPNNVKLPKTCRMKKCKRKPTDGAHVWLEGEEGGKTYYILPTCHTCNMKADHHKQYYPVKANSIVVPTPTKPPVILNLLIKTITKGLDQMSLQSN
jgi:hypothetical protein